MRHNFYLLSFGIGAMLLAADHALAQAAVPCAPREVMVTRLADHYGETPQSIGLGDDNTLVELFASLDTGSWSITVTRAGGPTCLVASGQHYQHVAEALTKQDRGA